MTRTSYSSAKPPSGSWYCMVCQKAYTQSRVHNECFKNFCRVCREHFKDPDVYKMHCEYIHGENYCKKCNVVVLDITKHACGKK